MTASIFPAAADPAWPPNLQIPQGEPPKEEARKGSKLNPLNWFKKEK